MAEKTAGQWVGTIVGAVVGFYLGDPVDGGMAGAVLTGASVGGAVGAALDPPKGPQLVGPRLSDLSTQTATYGAVIPRVYGTIAIHGNVFWLENNQLRENKHSESVGGKGGGGGSESTTYSYSATFAVGLCQGPIIGVRRIWVGSDLFYDAGSNDEGAIRQSNINAAGFVLYTGSETQLPDDRMQAALGVANTPAYRGLAYLVFRDFPLANYSNSLMAAQVKVEVCMAQTNAPFATSATFSSFELPPSGVNTGSNSMYLENPCDAFGRQNLFVRTTSIENCIRRLVGGVTDEWDYLSDIPPVSYYEFSGRVGFNSMSYMLFAEDVGATPDQYFVQYRIGEKITRLELPVTPGYFIQNLAAAEFAGVLWFKNGPYIWQTDGVLKNTGDVGSGMLVIRNGLPGVVYSPAMSASVWGSTIYYNEFNSDGSTRLSTSFYFTQTLPAKRYIQIDRGSTWHPPIVVGDHLYFTYISDENTDGHDTTVVCLIFDLANNALVRELNIGYSMGDGAFPGNYNASAWVSTSYHDGILYGQWKENGDYGKVHRVAFAPWAISGAGNALSYIVQSEVLRSKLLDAGDVDVTGLASTVVRGYAISNIGAIRAALNPLQAAWPFDVVQAGYQIKFKPRGSSSVATIEAADLDAHAWGEKPGVAFGTEREMDSVLPSKVSIKYLDINREYDIGEQYAERIGVASVNTMTMDNPIVMTAGEAAGNAEMLLYLYWLERYDVSIRLPPLYRHLEPADVITANAESGTYSLRLTGINYLPDGRMECSAKYNSSAIYTPAALGEEGKSTGAELGLKGPTSALLLDLPTLLDAMDGAGFSAAICGSSASWPGGTLSRTDDGGQTWTVLSSFGSPGAAIGRSLNAIDGAGGRLCMIDKANILQVRLTSGSLSSVTELAMLNGANYFAYGADGRWEIIAAQTCVLQGDGSYKLSDLLRGRFGSEWARGTHVIGDYVIHLDSAQVGFVATSINTIGIERTYRAVTLGAETSTASPFDFTYRGVNLECLAPIYPNGNRHPSTNDWTITWLRRTRTGGEWRDYVDASLGEATESYEIDVMSGSVVKRTLISSTPSVTYTSAQQIADFGSNQSILSLNIYQFSASVGRGYPLSTTLVR